MRRGVVPDLLAPAAIAVAVVAVIVGVVYFVSLIISEQEASMARVTAAMERRELVRICPHGEYIYRDKETGRLSAPWGTFAKDITIEQACAK